MVRSRRHAAGAEQLVARVNDTQLRLGFVAAGLGLTLVPASVAGADAGPAVHLGAKRPGNLSRKKEQERSGWFKSVQE
jgi:DNA-binding transcriptional LysR family regulator